MEKRLVKLSVCILIIMGLLLLRTGYIQIIGHMELSEAARLQQEIMLDGADSRGIIYDRNGTPLAGANREYIYIIEEEKYDGETQNALNTVKAEELPNEGSGYKVFASDVYDKEAGDRLISNSDAFILLADRRYEEDQSAAHLIGYINPKDKSGASGLELLYDEELAMLDRKVSAVADVQGELLQGHGLTVTDLSRGDSYIKDGITTTLETGLQKKAEEVLSETGRNGAVVVTDCITGEILASASTPSFDPSEIADYIESDKGELINKVTQGEYPPGSIFKLVVAAAAIESGADPEKKYTCSGKEQINGHEIACNTGGDKGHGKISLEQAMAYSCNCAFVRLGQELGAEAIIEMAGRLGLGKTVLEEYPGEKEGNVMTVQQSGGASIANLAIGQGETLVTPVQVAHLTSIVANDGVDTGLSVILNNDETTDAVRCISSGTAGTLQRMMNAVVTYGTGSSLALSVSAGAKTGSAESVQGGGEVVHGWITGFVPAEEPEYTVTVFIEEGGAGSTSAGPVFAEIADYISEQKMIREETGF